MRALEWLIMSIFHLDYWLFAKVYEPLIVRLCHAMNLSQWRFGRLLLFASMLILSALNGFSIVTDVYLISKVVDGLFFLFMMFISTVWALMFRFAPDRDIGERKMAPPKFMLYFLMVHQASFMALATKPSVFASRMLLAVLPVMLVGIYAFDILDLPPKRRKEATHRKVVWS